MKERISLKKTANKEIRITESQKNSLTTSLRIIERTLDEIDEYSLNKNKTGALYENIHDLSEQERLLLNQKIAAIKRYIAYFKNKLDLPKEKVSLKRFISSRLAGLWEITCELESKRLRGYGEIDPSLKRFSDPVVNKIIKLISEASDIFTKSFKP